MGLKFPQSMGYLHEPEEKKKEKKNRRSHVCANITLLTRKIQSHSLKKSRPLWAVMKDDSIPTLERRILIKKL